MNRKSDEVTTLEKISKGFIVLVIVSSGSLLMYLLISDLISWLKAQVTFFNISVVSLALSLIIMLSYFVGHAITKGE